MTAPGISVERALEWADCKVSSPLLQEIQAVAKILAAEVRRLHARVRELEAELALYRSGVDVHQTDVATMKYLAEQLVAARASAIEECAKACGQMLSMKEDDPACKIYDTALIDCAAAIRALKP